MFRNKKTKKWIKKSELIRSNLKKNKNIKWITNTINIKIIFTLFKKYRIKSTITKIRWIISS